MMIKHKVFFKRINKHFFWDIDKIESNYGTHSLVEYLQAGLHNQKTFEIEPDVIIHT